MKAETPSFFLIIKIKTLKDLKCSTEDSKFPSMSMCVCLNNDSMHSGDLFRLEELQFIECNKIFMNQSSFLSTHN